MKSPKIILLIIILIAAFFRFYMLKDLHPFIGDQAWFYLSARDLLSGHIPLVGITSSYTWLHQGALWTYMLAPFLLLFKFDPVGGAYLSAALGVLSVFMIYIVGKTLFKSEEMGLIAAALLALSPLNIAFSRMPYHTSPITLAVLVFIFAIYKYTSGKNHYLILASFMLGILYNLVLASMILWIVTLIIIFMVKKYNLKLFLISFFAFLIPMIPMILYDIQSHSGYYQITALPRLIKVGLFDSGGFYLQAYLNVFQQLLIYNQLLIVSANKIISAGIIFFSLLFLVWQSTIKRKNKFNFADVILGLWVFLSILSIFLNKTPSAAYLPMFLPGVILLISYVVIRLIQKNSKFRPILYAVIFVILFTNAYLTIANLYSTNLTNAITIRDYEKTSQEIVNKANDRKYNLISNSPGSEFKSFLQNYEYLTWRLGNEPSKEKQELIFEISDQNGKLFLKEYDQN